MTAEQIENPIPIQESHHFIRGFISKAWPAIRIDMVNHKADVPLCKSIEGGAFWDKHAEELMVALTGTFLFRGGRVAIEYMGTLVSMAIQFQGRRV